MDKRQIEALTRHSEVSEKEIEKYLAKRAAALGLPCLKYANANAAGYPDRLVLLPDGRVVWVELKSKGRKPTKQQLVRHQELRQAGHTVYVCDSREAVDNVIADIQREGQR